MKKQDYIHTGKNGYKIRVVSLVPSEPKRLLLIPPLVGAGGALAIKTFRYFFREGCVLMSFDYCGHCDKINNKFTIKGTFTDTEVGLRHALEQSKNIKIPMHTVGTCYGLIPLICVLDGLKWPREIKSMFSVSGLLSMDEVLSFDKYKVYLEKVGLKFKNKEAFIEYMSKNKEKFIKNKQKYIKTMTECLSNVFEELKDIISLTNFGALNYSNAKFYESFYEFMTLKIPEIVIPKYFPCLFFSGIHDAIFNLDTDKNKTKYLDKMKKMSPHAQFRRIKIDHFGRGEDHYVIGREGMEFLVKSEKN